MIRIPAFDLDNTLYEEARFFNSLSLKQGSHGSY